MEANYDNSVATDTSKITRPKTIWDHNTLMVFIDLCMNEVKNGNIPGSHFNKVRWGNLEKNIKERTGKCFDKKQLKNKWDNMKKEWKLYDRLMRIESGIGWDPVRKTILATNEWWDEKIKGDKDLAKFRDLNLEIYESHYGPLFRDSVAVGDKTKAPVECQNNSSPTNVQVEEDNERKGDSDEVNLGANGEPIHRHFHVVLKVVLKLSADIIKPNATCNEDVPVHILNNPRYYPMFKDCIGAIDGTHVRASVREHEQGKYIGRKGYATQNIMAVCNFNMCFTFAWAGWEGTAHDTRIFYEALRRHELKFPNPIGDKYYLVDAGYPNTKGYLAPYKGTNIRYHIPDFRRG